MEQGYQNRESWLTTTSVFGVGLAAGAISGVAALAFGREASLEDVIAMGAAGMVAGIFAPRLDSHPEAYLIPERLQFGTSFATGMLSGREAVRLLGQYYF